MKIAIVHLSDIHVRGSSDFVLGRPQQIAAAAKSAAVDPDLYLLVVTGDIAFSGSSREYELAACFLKEIVESVGSEGKSVFQCLLPGNHDLDFSADFATLNWPTLRF